MDLLTVPRKTKKIVKGVSRKKAKEQLDMTVKTTPRFPHEEVYGWDINMK